MNMGLKLKWVRSREIDCLVPMDRTLQTPLLILELSRKKTAFPGTFGPVEPSRASSMKLRALIPFSRALWSRRSAIVHRRKLLITNDGCTRLHCVAGGGPSAVQGLIRNVKAHTNSVASSRETISIGTPASKISRRLPEYDS